MCLQKLRYLPRGSYGICEIELNEHGSDNQDGSEVPCQADKYQLYINIVIQHRQCSAAHALVFSPKSGVGVEIAQCPASWGFIAVP